MVSTDFFASDFIHQQELPDIFSAMEDEGLKTVSLIVKPCDYTEHPTLKNIQTVNPPEHALSGLSEHEQEEFLIKLIKDVKQVMIKN